MAFPPLVASGDLIAASHVNAIRNGQMTWAGDVDADGHNLSDVGTLTAVTGTFSGVLSGASAAITGAVTAASITVTASVTAATGAFSGAVTVASLTASGAVSGATGTFSGALSSGAASFTGPSGGTSASFSDGINSTLMVKHGASPVANSAVLEGTGGTSIVMKASLGIVARVANTSKESIGQVTIADGSTVALSTLCAGGAYGSLKIIAVAGNIFGEVLIQGGLNSVTQISDLSSNISTTDTAGQLCVLAAGSGAYSIKNRIGASVTLVVRFMGL